jgi:hypothetical protein
MTEQEQLQTTESRESIKLMKMSKGYNWEVKIFIDREASDTDVKTIQDMCDARILLRLKKINDEMVKEYGSILN